MDLTKEIITPSQQCVTTTVIQMINVIHYKIKLKTIITLKFPSHQPDHSINSEGEYLVYILPNKKAITKSMVNDAQSIN